MFHVEHCEDASVNIAIDGNILPWQGESNGR